MAVYTEGSMRIVVEYAYVGGKTSGDYLPVGA